MAILLCVAIGPWIVSLILGAQWVSIGVSMYLFLIGALFLLQSSAEQRRLRRMEDLIVDLHRFDLYRALRWPLPKSPEEEDTLGMQLSKSLAGGFVGIGNFEYVQDAKTEAEALSKSLVVEAIHEAFDDTPEFSRFQGWMSAGARRTDDIGDDPNSKTTWTVDVELGPNPAEDLNVHKEIDISGEVTDEVVFALRLDSDFIPGPDAYSNITVVKGGHERVHFKGIRVPSDIAPPEAAIWISLIQQGEVMQVAKVVLEDAQGPKDAPS